MPVHLELVALQVLLVQRVQLDPQVKMELSAQLASLAALDTLALLDLLDLRALRVVLERRAM